MTDQLEVILNGSPGMALELMKGLAERLKAQGYCYSVRRTSGEPSWAKWDRPYFISATVFEHGDADQKRIGVIKMQLLPEERTLFTLPESSNWHESFRNFLSFLFTEFQRLGFVHFEKDKPPLGFRLPHGEKDD